MSKKSARNAGYLKYQASLHQKTQKADKAKEAESQQEAAKEFLKALFNKFAELQFRHKRLSVAFADRCWRVHELHQLCRQEWERAEAAEEKIRELRDELVRVQATNEHSEERETVTV